MPAEPDPSSASLDAPPATDPIDDWLKRRRALVTGALILIALTLRLACLLELAASPCFYVQNWDQTDMYYFDAWAQRIADGDLLSRSIAPPIHGWHEQIARDYAREFPQRWAALTEEHPDNPVAALWNQWAGGGRFYQDPLYAYLLAGISVLFGGGVLATFLLQSLAGIATIVLAYLIARRTFGDLAGVVAAASLLLYAPLLFYEFVLLRTTLITFLGLAIVYVMQRATRSGSGSWIPHAGAGALCGIAMLLKASFALLTLGLFVLLLARRRTPRRTRLLTSASFALGAAVAFAPVIVRNVAVGAPPLVTASGGAATFVIANLPGAGYASWATDNAARVLGQSGGGFLSAARLAILSHQSIGSYLALVFDKFIMTWHGTETPNNVNFYYYRLHASVLNALPVNFGMIAAAALVGMVLALRRRRDCAVLLVLVATHLIALLTFFVYARFRLPLAAALAPFAGFAAAEIVRGVRLRRWRGVATLVASILLICVWTLSPSLDRDPRVHAADVAVAYRVYYTPRINAALASGDVSGAAAVYAESLRAMPRSVARLDTRHAARSPGEAELAVLYADLYERAVELLRHSGNVAQAERYARRARELRAAAGG